VTEKVLQKTILPLVERLQAEAKEPLASAPLARCSSWRCPHGQWRGLSISSLSVRPRRCRRSALQTAPANRKRAPILQRSEITEIVRRVALNTLTNYVNEIGGRRRLA
jgi:hypothetical protein